MGSGLHSLARLGGGLGGRVTAKGDKVRLG